MRWLPAMFIMLIYSLALEGAEKLQALESWHAVLIAKKGQRHRRAAVVNLVVTLLRWALAQLMLSN
jgi:hypothetical protein